jgi:hypothetical protein
MDRGYHVSIFTIPHIFITPAAPVAVVELRPLLAGLAGAAPSHRRLGWAGWLTAASSKQQAAAAAAAAASSSKQQQQQQQQPAS